MSSSTAPTLTAIAEACGVSAMTVSRVLSNRGPVSEATRRKVMATARRIGYLRRPRMGRPASRSTERQMVELVVCLVGKNLPAFHAFLLTALERHLSEANFDCVVRTCDDDYDSFVRLSGTLRGSKAVATILVGEFPQGWLRHLVESRPGVVLVDNPGDPTATMPFDSFGFDNVEAAAMGVRHLHQIGRRRVLLVTGTPGHFFSEEVEVGYRSTLKALGVPIDPRLIVHADFSADGAEHVLAEALRDRKIAFDAVLTSDEMAAGVYRALHQRGKRIPQDVAVCGCDGLPLGMYLYPRLSTVVLDYAELARRTVNQLVSEPGDTTAACRVRLLPKLLIRESTA